MDVAVLAKLRVAMKQTEKINEYLDLAREMRKLYNVGVTVASVVIGC